MVSHYDRRSAKSVYRLYNGHDDGRTRSRNRSDSRGRSRSRGRSCRWRVAPAPAPTSGPAPSPAACHSSCTAPPPRSTGTPLKAPAVAGTVTVVATIVLATAAAASIGASASTHRSRNLRMAPTASCWPSPAKSSRWNPLAHSLQMRAPVTGSIVCGNPCRHRAHRPFALRSFWRASVSCVIPGAYPAAPWWRSQARRGPCPPTPTTVQATRTQKHDDAPFRCNTLGRAPVAILRPRPRPPLAPPTERGRRRGRRKAHPGPILYCPPNWNGKWRTAQGSGTWRANCRTPVDEDINRHLARPVWPWGGRVGSVSLGRDRDG